MADLAAPLPLRSDPAPNSWAARSVPFDREDPRWAEPLVSLSEMHLPTLPWYARTDGRNAPYHRAIAGAVPFIAVRRSVAARLQQADELLRPHGCRLLIVDGYRTIETQRGLWDFFAAKIAAEHPNIEQNLLDDKVRTFVSDPRRFNPNDETTWPLHTTGGAVDVLLADDKTGAALDLGAAFDEAHERSYTDHYERLLVQGEIARNDPRLRHRRLLVNAMLKAGFTNYAYEFWHFDYGTQLYALTLQKSGAPSRSIAAWYGTTVLPETAA